MRNYNGIQTKLEQIGKYGCYLLSIANHFEYQGDIVDFYDKCLKEKWIEEDCTVLNPAAIAHYLGGGNWMVIKSNTPLEMNDADFYVECWKNNRTGYTHFRLPESDTLKNSVTVKEGKIVSYRIFMLQERR